MWIQKHAKFCCHKSLSCACIYIAVRRLDYCTQEAVLSQRAATCGFTSLSKTQSVFTRIASVCPTMKSVLLLNSSCSNSSVDDVLSKLLRSKVYQQIFLDLAALLFSLWTMQTHKRLLVHTDTKLQQAVCL